MLWCTEDVRERTPGLQREDVRERTLERGLRVDSRPGYQREDSTDEAASGLDPEQQNTQAHGARGL